MNSFEISNPSSRNKLYNRNKDILYSLYCIAVLSPLQWNFYHLPLKKKVNKSCIQYNQNSVTTNNLVKFFYGRNVVSWEAIRCYLGFSRAFASCIAAVFVAITPTESFTNAASWRKTTIYRYQIVNSNLFVWIMVYDTYYLLLSFEM